jgi:hypothetical protein
VAVGSGVGFDVGVSFGFEVSVVSIGVAVGGADVGIRGKGVCVGGTGVRVGGNGVDTSDAGIGVDGAGVDVDLGVAAFGMPQNAKKIRARTTSAPMSPTRAGSLFPSGLGATGFDLW